MSDKQDFDVHPYPYNPRKIGDKVRVCRAGRIYEGKVVDIRYLESKIYVLYWGPFRVRRKASFNAYTLQAFLYPKEPQGPCIIHLLE